jgi:hypothetical protein
MEDDDEVEAGEYGVRAEVGYVEAEGGCWNGVSRTVMISLPGCARFYGFSYGQLRIGYDYDVFYVCYCRIFI